MCKYSTQKKTKKKNQNAFIWIKDVSLFSLDSYSFIVIKKYGKAMGEMTPSISISNNKINNKMCIAYLL